MATIPQERYVKIISSNVGDPAVTDRELGGLVFTQGKGWIGTDPMPVDKVFVYYSVDQMKGEFNSESPEMKFAERYFSYLSPSGSAPVSLTFARVKVTNTDGALLIWKVPSSATRTSVTATLTAVSGTVTVPKGTKAVDDNGYTYSLQADVTATTTGVSSTFLCDSYGDIACGANKLNIQGVSGVTMTNTAGTPGTAYAWYTEGTSGTVVTSPTKEAPKDALSRINQGTNNFGSFTFIDTDEFDCDAIEAVAIQNKGYNYKYLMSVSVHGTGTTATGTSKLNAITAAAFDTYIRTKDANGINGLVVVKGDSALSAEMPMAIASATNYDGVNTATYQMFKQFSGEGTTVDNTSDADAMDKAYINYNGKVQVNGVERAFYQRGVNYDGENTSVYCNEIWLKSRISTDIMDLLLTTERIPANSDGELMIYGVVTAAAEKGVTNGVIEKGKTLTTAQKTKIYQLTGNSEAWFTVQQTGYVCTVEIKQVNNEYKAYYKLVYSKGDSISYVEGTDILV